MANNANNIIIGAAQVFFDNVDIGYTKGGTTIRQGIEPVDIVADQVVGVVKKARSIERMYVKTMMLEATLVNLRQAFMLPSANLVGNTLTLGYNSSCWVGEVAVKLVGRGPSCGTRTFTLGRCVTFGEKEYVMKRDEETVIPVEFEILKDSSGHFGTIQDT